MTPPSSAICEECGSPFFPARSTMAGLCPECAHVLYGTPKCDHAFESGRCTICGWDGSRSDYLNGLLDEDGG